MIGPVEALLKRDGLPQQTQRGFMAAHARVASGDVNHGRRHQVLVRFAQRVARRPVQRKGALQVPQRLREPPRLPQQVAQHTVLVGQLLAVGTMLLSLERQRSLEHRDALTSHTLRQSGEAPRW
jgi:hypothetical protein